MAFIHSIGKSPGITQTSDAQQLGTESFDFMALLGLQAANQSPEWWQVASDAAKLGPQDSGDAPSFGQDAALPITAEQALAAALNAQTAPLPSSPSSLPTSTLTLPSPLSVPVPPSSELPKTSLPESAVEPKAVPMKETPETVFLTLAPQSFRESEDRSSGEPGVLTGLDVQALMQTPVEQLEPKQLKQLVNSVWGDVKEIQVEDAPEQSHADSTQHSLLKLMAMRNDEGRRPEVKNDSAAAPVKAEPQNLTSVASHSLEETIEKPRADKKDTASHSEASLNLASGERIQDSSQPFEAAVKPADQGQVSSHSKLMPQVLPKLENLMQQGGGKLTMELDPPELGRLTIELTQRGKNVELAIRADNDQTRVALEGGMADLQQALQSQDLNLTSAEVHTARESSFASMQFGQGPNHQESSSREGSSRSFQGQGQQERHWSRDLFTEMPVTRNRAAGRLDVRV